MIRYCLLPVFIFVLLSHGIAISQVTMVLVPSYSFTPLNHGFNGVTQLTADRNVYQVPKLIGGSGFGLMAGIGAQYKRYVYVAFKYSLNSYDGFYMNYDLGTTRMHTVGVAARIYPNRLLPGRADKFLNSKFYYYLLSGADAGLITARNCHYIDTLPSSKDAAIFTTLDIPVGAGIAFKLRPTFMADIDAAYRIGFLNYVRGKSEIEVRDIKKDIWIGGFMFQVGISWYFAIK